MQHTMLNSVPALPCLIACRSQLLQLTEVPRGPQLLRQLRDLPALPCSVADGQAQDVRAVGERRDSQSIHVGPQLRLCGCRAVQLTLPVLICGPKRERAVLCMRTPLVSRSEPKQGCTAQLSRQSDSMYCQDGECAGPRLCCATRHVRACLRLHSCCPAQLSLPGSICMYSQLGNVCLCSPPC